MCGAMQLCAQSGKVIFDGTNIDAALKALMGNSGMDINAKIKNNNGSYRN